MRKIWLGQNLQKVMKKAQFRTKNLQNGWQKNSSDFFGRGQLIGNFLPIFEHVCLIPSFPYFWGTLTLNLPSLYSNKNLICHPTDIFQNSDKNIFHDDFFPHVLFSDSKNPWAKYPKKKKIFFHWKEGMKKTSRGKKVEWLAYKRIPRLWSSGEPENLILESNCECSCT